MKINKIYACWVYVSDLQKSINFYTSIGFTVKLTDNDWVEFDLGETSFAILQRPADKGKVTPEKTRIMFMIDDIESMYKTLKQQNVTLIGGIRDESYGKLLTLADPDGHWLEFFQR